MSETPAERARDLIEAFESAVRIRSHALHVGFTKPEHLHNQRAAEAALLASLTQSQNEVERLRKAVPEGHVRLPDGRDVKVLGTLPMTGDGCVIGTGADLYSWWLPQYTDDEGSVRHSVAGSVVSAPHKCYSTREAATVLGASK